MEIFILRHGDANANAKKLIDDSKRSLSEVGIKEIENVTQFFARFEIRFDCIFSSPLKRAKQTSEIIVKSQKKSEFVLLNELKPEGSVDDLCKKIVKHGEGTTILLVGHIPLLIDLVDYVISSENHRSSNFSLKTGGLIKINTISIEPKLKGQLEWLLSPKLIRKVSK